MIDDLGRPLLLKIVCEGKLMKSTGQGGLRCRAAHGGAASRLPVHGSNTAHWENENLGVFPLPHFQHLVDYYILPILDSYL